ncbi:MAG: Do family serine endopeptidase [Treponema sp.]|uniref:Do family serine endopeptidase n=1 Tax=Treponema sp. TaxID=166 RepID=UPI0025E4E396|nr:Do family serine endopeptidase [Treponema sp.]MBQ9282605.1 Do family serine endopeptidase [Treponema sp.]
MKKITKHLLAGTAACALAFAALSLSCTRVQVQGSAATAFADTSKPAVTIPSESLKVIEALQSSFRSISSGVLPSVVEIDVTEKKEVQAMNPFEGFDGWPFDFFFGNPNPDRDSSKNNKKREYEQKGLGSGVIVRRTGDTVYVLTNNHVAGKATNITVKLNDGQEFEGKLVGADERQDIALVSFDAKDAEGVIVATLGDSDKVQTGDICLAMGAPLGYRQSVTQGIVSATGRSGDQIGNMNDFIQTDAAINQGNSGGPLVNIYGEVIGINTWIASGSGGSVGLGFALPINSVKKAIDDFISKGKITYGWLGISLVDVTDDYKNELGVKGQKGAFASQVFINSPAAKGGMQAGDYIIAINGKDVKSQSELIREVAYLPADKNAEFVVIRGGSKLTITVKIEERTEAVSNDNAKLWPGFIASPLNKKLRESLKVDDSVKGVAVTNVLEKSPAAALRIQNGDIITAVNDKKVSNLREFYEALDLSRNKEIWFDVYNDGHTISTGKYKLK